MLRNTQFYPLWDTAMPKPAIVTDSRKDKNNDYVQNTSGKHSNVSSTKDKNDNQIDCTKEIISPEEIRLKQKFSTMDKVWAQRYKKGRWNAGLISGIIGNVMAKVEIDGKESIFHFNQLRHRKSSFRFAEKAKASY
jgi:hypothetical protein